MSMEHWVNLSILLKLLRDGRIEKLPDHMKLCFLQLHNSINQMVANFFREQRLDVLPYSRKVWTDLCKTYCETYLLEVKWYHNGYTQTLQEYFDNAVVSIGAPIILHYAYSLVSNQITRAWNALNMSILMSVIVRHCY
ncbi:hypothetical protein SLA2020_186400 [Shorea laevis]